MKADNEYRLLFSMLLLLGMSACEGGESVEVDNSNENKGAMAATADTSDSSGSMDSVLREQLDEDMVRVVSMEEEMRMQEYLDKLIDPSSIVKSYTTVSGEAIDCVEIYSQPALLKKGRVLQLRPETLPVEDGAGTVSEDELLDENTEFATQEAIGTGGEKSCPANSIPMLKLSMDTLRRFRTLDDFRKKVPSHILENYSGSSILAPKQDDDSDSKIVEEEASTVETAGTDAEQSEVGNLLDDVLLPRTGATSLHQYAHAYRFQNNRGLEGVFNIWNPYVYKSNEFSLVQMWNVRGSGSDRQTVEGGIQKYKDLYGDWNARLFIYFTPDNYGSGGCYNLSCGEFVQVDDSVVIGGKFDAYSETDGAQKIVKLHWYKDGANGHWWLKYGSTWVGYYPRDLFDSAGLASYGSKIDFGGEIIDQQTDGLHTHTDMGSGAFPYLGNGKAAYIRNLYYIDLNNYYQDASSLTESMTDRWCYDIEYYETSGSWDHYFYYGGSGRNTYCE